MSADQIVNHGSKSWNIIAGTQPNPSLASEICNAVPDVGDWTSITPGQLGTAVTWPIERKIPPIPLVYPLELPAVYIEIVLKFKFGSRYKNGGAYIEACWFEVPKCFLEWGFEVWLGADVDYVKNVGAPKAPIGLLRITARGEVKTKAWDKPLHRNFEVRGDGQIDLIF